MGFVSSLARSKFAPIFKHPLAQNLSKCGKFGGFTCNDQAFLFSRTHKRVHFSSSNLGLTHLRNYHYGHGSVTKHGVRKWGPWVCFACVGMIGYSVLVCWNKGHWETVPYTKRDHFVPSINSIEFENKAFDRVKDRYKSRIVDKNDPTSQRILPIFVDILDALANDLKVGSMSLSYALPSQPVWEKEKGEKMSELEEISERKGGRYHLNGMQWEVMVIDSDVVYVFCLPNGKFVVSTGLLKICESDDEIATVIGHEVGHVVARHESETVMFHFWVKVLLSVFDYIPGLDKLIKDIRTYLMKRPLPRRKEVEADQIGLMLMASAGYNPRKAPDVYKKLDSRMIQFIKIHPLGKKRAKILANGTFMQEAVAVYNKVTAGAKQVNKTDISTNSD